MLINGATEAKFDQFGPRFLHKAHANMDSGKTKKIGTHTHFFGRQNWSFLTPFLTFPELRAGFPGLRAEQEL